MKTYLFYDIETSGLNPAFDQVLTFACIRTDLELNEIDRQTITICLRKDIVPSPYAFLTHKLTYKELGLGVCEYKAAQEIHKILNRPGTISLGYNSLGFDDEFLRFLFYRNLLDPYQHQYANGCSRMDILPIALIFKVFHPAGINWPQVDGKPSLKLDLIARENNFITSGRAHEAMNDVEAVLGLAKTLFKQKDIWKYCLDFFNKKRDEVRINTIKEDFHVQTRRFRVCILAATSFGSDVNYLAPAVHLGPSIPYKNQSLWLRLDLEDILGLDAKKDTKDTFVTRKRSGDALIVLPALERFWEKIALSSRRAATDNMEKINRHWEKFFEFIDYHTQYKYPIIPDMDPDAALYQDGFFSFREKEESSLFHQTLDHKKHSVVSRMKSPRLKILANRILARNFEHRASQAEGTDYHLHLFRLRSCLEKDQIVGYKNDKKFNREQGLSELKEAQKQFSHPDPDQKKILDWIKDYIEKL